MNKPLSVNQKRQVYTANARLSVKFTASSAADAPDDGADGWSATLSGYALTWNTLSEDRGGYKVKLAPGSANFLNPTFALWHHDYAQPLASTSNNTLRIIPDDYGVKVEIDLPDTQAGRDAYALVKRGDVAGMSFGMLDIEGFSEDHQNDETIVTFTKYSVDEVTVTAIPAFTSTSIEVKGDATGGDYASRLAVDTAKLDRIKLAMFANGIL